MKIASSIILVLSVLVFNQSNAFSDNQDSLLHASYDWGEIMDLDHVKQPDLENVQRVEAIYNIEKVKLFEETPYLYWLFILLFIAVLYLKFSNPENFTATFKYMLNGRFFMDEISKAKSSYSINSAILDLLFVAILAMLFFARLWADYHYFYIEIAGVVLGVYLIQIAMVIIGHTIFFGTEQKNLHLQNILIFNRGLAIIMVPLLFIAVFSKIEIRNLLLTSGGFLIGFIYVFRFFRILFQLKREYTFSYLYIFLYLCIFELSLYFVFIKEIKWLFN